MIQFCERHLVAVAMCTALSIIVAAHFVEGLISSMGF